MLQFDKLSILDKHVNYLNEKLNNQHLFLVGGSIRDLLLGITEEPNDIDVTLAGQPKEIDSKIDKKNISYFMTEKFGTMTIIPKQNGNIENGKMENEGVIEGLKYEITPFRTEGKYDDFRHPGEINRVDDLLLDSDRREFTISCLYYFKSAVKFEISHSARACNPLSIFDFDMQVNLLAKLGYSIFDQNILVVQNHEDIIKLFEHGHCNTEYFGYLVGKVNDYCKQHSIDFSFSGDEIRVVVDPHKGIDDLLAGNLKAVGNPDNRFREDALRIIRAVRFVNVINTKSTEKNKKIYFDFEKNTWSALKKNFYLVQFVAKERIKDELVKVFKKGNPFGFIAVLDELNLLKFLFPALALTKNVHQPVRYHPFDVYAHTMLCLYELQKINKNYLVRFGMLYHDVGKVDQYYAHSIGMTRDEIRETLGTWLNHQRGGIDIARKDFQSLGFSTKEIEEICRYIEYHHKPGEILDADPRNRIKKVRKLLSESGYDKFKNLIDVCMADRLGQYNPIQTSNVTDVLELQQLLDKVNSEEGQFTMKDMVVNGNTIMEYFNLPAGPTVGDLMQKAFDRVLNNVKERNDKKVILKHLKELC